MNRYVLTVTCNPAIDKTIKIDNFRLGLEHRFRDVYRSAGGKGVNVSQALKKVGIESLATGFLGGKSGEYIKEKLEEEGIQTDFIRIKGETRTSLTIIDKKLKKTTRILEPGPTVNRKDIICFKKKFQSLLKQCFYVVFSGRNIPGASDSFYYDLIKLAEKQRKPAILDTSGKPLLLGIKAKPFLIKPNLKEAEYILGKKLNHVWKLRLAVKELLELGIENVIISMGREGVVASDGRETWFAKPHRRKAINPVGSGDALIGGFLYSKIKGKRFKEAVKIAVAAGTANALSVNPGEFKKKAVFDIAKSVKLNRYKLW